MSFNQFCPLHGFWFVAMEQTTDADIIVEKPELQPCLIEDEKPDLKLVSKT